jgi:hypothetical protein
VPKKAPALHGAVVVPAMIADADDRAARRFLEFFAADIRNTNTACLLPGRVHVLWLARAKTGSAT